MKENDPSCVRAYLFDISKIVEGAANADYDKVVAYVEQLENRLKSAGEKEGAKRIRDILSKGKARRLSLARSSPGTAIGSPVDSESRMPTTDTERPEAGQVSLFLDEHHQQEVSRFLQYLRAADRLIANGVGISPSMLIYGPPGCGKTQLARYVAAELKLPLLTARMDGLISSYLGSTAKNLRALFEYAASQPCVLFLDEFDAIAKMRDDGKELGELKRVVISLLQNIDAIGQDHVLIAATNHEHLLDPAIWRRFAFKLQITPPSAQTRALMLREFFRGFANDDQIEALSELAEGATGAQLRQIAEDAVRDAILSDRQTIIWSKAIDAVLPIICPNEPIPKTLAGKLKLIHDRKPNDFSQRRLGKMFDISQPRVCQLLSTGAEANGG